MFHDFNTSADVLSFKFCEKHGDTRKNEDKQCKRQKSGIPLQHHRKVESRNERDFIGPDGGFLFQESFHADEYYFWAVWVEENMCCSKHLQMFQMYVSALQQTPCLLSLIQNRSQPGSYSRAPA